MKINSKKNIKNNRKHSRKNVRKNKRSGKNVGKYSRKNIMRGGVLSAYMEDIIRNVKNNVLTLTILDIQGNFFFDEGAKKLAIALKDNRTLTTLDISRNNIGVDGAQAIAAGLENNKTLITLNIYSNNIGDGGAVAIAGVLNSMEALTTLNISSNDIGDTGAIALAGALRNNTNLEILYINYNNISSTGTQAIAKALEGNTTLTTLDISDNNIGDGGAVAIAGVLNSMKALTTLNISSNNIGPKGALAIVRVLKVNTTLTNLDIGVNTIGLADTELEVSEFMEALRTLLKKNITLTQLNIMRNNFNKNNLGGEIMADVLEDVLKHNITLTSINIAGNRISVDEVKKILSGLTQNTTLIKLNMNLKNVSSTFFGYHGDEFTEELKQAVQNIELLINRNIQLDINRQKHKLSENLYHTQTIQNQFKELVTDGTKYISMYNSNILSITNTPKNNNKLKNVKKFINSIKLNTKIKTNIMELNKTKDGKLQAQALIFNIPLYMHLEKHPSIDRMQFINDYKKYLTEKQHTLPLLPKKIWKLILDYLSLEVGQSVLKGLKRSN